MWKWILGVQIFAVIAVVAAGFWLVSSGKAKEIAASLNPAAKPTEVRIEAVSKGDLVRFVNAPGSIEPDVHVKVSAQVSARIIALPFKEGDSVKAGDIVVRLDATEYQAQLESSQAALKGEEARLEGAEAELARVTAELGRTRELFDSKDLAKASLDEIESTYTQARTNVIASKFGIEIAKSNITRAQKDLDLCTLKSSIDGTITKLSLEVGEQVLGTFQNEGTVIAMIADLSRMIMKARIDETNVAPVKVGQHARVYLNMYPERTFEGDIQMIKLAREIANDGTGYVEAEILLKLSEGDLLRTGLTANTDIEVETLREVVKIPSQAVLDRRVDDLPPEVRDHSTVLDKNKAFARVVFLMGEDGKAKANPVLVGSSDLTHTVVLAGLEPGQKIITGPYRSIANLTHNQVVVDETTVKKDDKEKDKDKPQDQKVAGK